MFGHDYESRFSLPPVPIGTEVAREHQRGPAQPSAPSASPPVSPGSLGELHTALETLPKLDPDYSAAVSDAFSAIGLICTADNNPSFA